MALWKRAKVDLKVISSSNRMINVLIKDRKRGWWLFYAIYPINSIRSKLWEALKEIIGINNFPWLITKDFNEVGSALNKSGKACFFSS